MDKLPISLCMIVKNEERHLGACLDSVYTWIDEIIILDTGSTDSTAEIAKRYGARICNHPWKNDFAEARNASLNHAKNPWILQLDADELINQEDIPWFYDSYPWVDASGYYLDIHNLKDENSDEVSLIHRLVRFYKNHPDIYYESAIHESLHIPKSQVKNSPVRIIHKGYNHQTDTKSKRQRNLAILRAKLKNDPHNPFLLAYLAQHYQMEGQLEKAVGIAKKSLWYGVTFPMRRHLLHLCFDYAFSKRDDKLINKFFNMLPSPDSFPDVYYYQGRYLELKGNPREAGELYRTYRQKTTARLNKQNDSFIPDLEVDIRRREARIRAQNDQFHEASELMKETVAITPSLYQLWAELGQYQFKAGQIDQASQSFRNVLSILEQSPETQETVTLKQRYSQLLEKLKLLILQ